MNEATPLAKKLGFSPTVTYVLEKALLLATANGIHLKDAARQVLEAIELVNGRLYPATDGPH